MNLNKKASTNLCVPILEIFLLAILKAWRSVKDFETCVIAITSL